MIKVINKLNIFLKKVTLWNNNINYKILKTYKLDHKYKLKLDIKR